MTGSGDGSGDLLDGRRAVRLASELTDLLEAARSRILREKSSDLVSRVTGHVGCDLAEMPNVSMSFGGWEHANVQRGFDAMLAERAPEAEWFGVSAGYGRQGSQGLQEILSAAQQHGMVRLGAVDYKSVAVGPDELTEAVQLGFVASYAPDGSPVVFGVRGPQEHSPPACLVQVFAASREVATKARDDLESHIRAVDVHRGAVLQFDIGDQRGNELVTFLERPRLNASDVVLPSGALEAIERHVVRSAERSARLVELGQHLKRGLLLYGPPGTGKTHTVRYLLSRLEGVTAAVLSGRALTRLLPAATALVRQLQPAVLVIEDVDLIAEDRSASHGATPLLFELLNRIDGIDSDADVTFVLTTNRVDVLEQALADRPGRIDLAVEVPRPDAAARERLLRLYAGPTRLDVPDPAELIAATEGVTASFVREWVRRTIVMQLSAGTDDPVLDETHLRATLEELTQQRHQLTGRLLGGRPAPEAS